MRELLRTNDWVRLSWAQAILAAEGIPSHIADLHTSVLEGSVGAIPRRLMVDEKDHARAARVLVAAEQALR